MSAPLVIVAVCVVLAIAWAAVGPRIVQSLMVRSIGLPYASSAPLRGHAKTTAAAPHGNYRVAGEKYEAEHADELDDPEDLPTEFRCRHGRSPTDGEIDDCKAFRSAQCSDGRCRYHCGKRCKCGAS